MSIAAYNRGSQVIADNIKKDYPDKAFEFELMDRVNAQPKYPDSQRPVGSNFTITRVSSVYWLEDKDAPNKSGKWYTTLSQCVRSWDIYLTGYDQTTNTWTAKSI